MKDMLLSFKTSLKNLSPRARLHLTVLGAPILIVFLYLSLIHSPMYESEAIFAVRSSSSSTPTLDIASQFFKTSSSSLQDAQVVEAYIKSIDLFNTINTDLDLVGHYADSGKDPISRLAADPTNNERLEYWHAVAKTSLDTDSGILVFRVRAYSKEMAQKITRAVLMRSEDLVNSMNKRAQEDTLKLAELEVRNAQLNLSKSQDALTAFRAEHQDLDLKSTASGLQSVIIGLENERAKNAAQLSQFASYMKKDAPMRKSLEANLKALDSQIAKQKQRLADSGSSGSLNENVSEYEKLTLNHEFAQKQLTSALAALEAARVSQLSKTRYLVSIEKPSLPDESLYPKVMRFTSVFALMLLLLYGLLNLVIASIREHVGF